MPERVIETAHFPVVTKHSRLLPGPERIRGSRPISRLWLFYGSAGNVFYDEPISGLPDGSVKTVYDVVRRGERLSKNGLYVGEVRSVQEVFVMVGTDGERL